MHPSKKHKLIELFNTPEPVPEEPKMQPEGSEKAVKGAGNISKDTKEPNVDSDESPKKQVLEQEVDGVQKPPGELKKPTENIEKPSEDLSQARTYA